MHVVADGQVFPRCEGQDAQPRVLRRRPQKAQQTIHERNTYKNIFMSASEKHETRAVFKVKAACATLAATTAKPSRFRGASGSMVEGFFKHVAIIRHSAVALAAAVALTGCGDTGVNEPWD